MADVSSKGNNLIRFFSPHGRLRNLTSFCLDSWRLTFIIHDVSPRISIYTEEKKKKKKRGKNTAYWCDICQNNSLNAILFVLLPRCHLHCPLLTTCRRGSRQGWIIHIFLRCMSAYVMYARCCLPLLPF